MLHFEGRYGSCLEASSYDTMKTVKLPEGKNDLEICVARTSFVSNLHISIPAVYQDYSKYAAFDYLINPLQNRSIKLQ